MADLRYQDAALTVAEQEAIHQLLVEAKAVDRPDGIAVDTPSFLTDGSGYHILAAVSGDIVGYAHLDEVGDSQGNEIAELVVHPGHRGQGIGRTLADSVIRKAAGARLRFWSHGNHPAADVLASQLGFRRVREVKRLRRDVAGLPDLVLPAGIRLRPFQPGHDEQEVVAVNHAAFSWHPEQSGMSTADLQQAQAQPWFDPDGFLLAVDDEDQLLGFHWTKVHSAVPELVGEVYVVGVAPAAQGQGLGKALTLAGLHYLASRGLHRVMLYVESDNLAALQLYTRLGFVSWDADVQYGK